MGYLSIITLHCDAMNAAASDTAAFGTAALAAVTGAEQSRQRTSVSLGNYANYLNAYPPKHTSSSALYMLHGGRLFDINSVAFDELRVTDPALAEEILHQASQCIAHARFTFPSKKEKLQAPRPAPRRDASC